MNIRNILLSLALIATMPAVAEPVKITASIDSAVIEMGSLTNITVNVVDSDKAGYVAELPNSGDQFDAFDVVSVDVDTLPAGIQYKIGIQAFIPGMITIDPFHYIMGDDTINSDIVTLKVLPVELDSLQTINPMESVVNPPRKWYDIIPNWLIWALLCIVLIALIVAAVRLWLQYRKTGTISLHKPKPIDPYERAIKQLASLREQKLAESGQEKEYYTALVDILRLYLQGRFGINAMEMTSTQILTSLRKNPETRNNQERIKQILEIADFVKFAKVRPLPDDNVKSYNNVSYFVESTKPLPVEEENDKTDENKNNQNK